MKFIFFALILGSILCAEVDLNADIKEYSPLRFKYGNHTINRPLFHYTPDYGWMNDPNGCWYDPKNDVYHLYFQYYPADTIWTMPLYWGHATSKNLLLWEQQKIAIQPIDKLSGAYSGSIFIDDDNGNNDISTFDFFFRNDSTLNITFKGKNKVIAAWTYTEVGNGQVKTWHEFQYLSYSLDDGYTFRTPENNSLENFENPVAFNGTFTKEFRDPQVIKVAKNTFIMSVAKAHDYQIEFYKNEGRVFKKLGEFGLIGYLGYQYECPNLVHLNCSVCKDNEPIYNKSSYWVLFISINPGSIQGGSSTQYFIGTFDYTGSSPKPFTVDNSRTTVIDYGKDFYAMQLFFQIPEMVGDEAKPFATAIGVGWASNWQYTALVPTDPWRSSMSIPREIKLVFYQPASHAVDNGIIDDSPRLLYLAQKPLLSSKIFDYTTFPTVKTFKYYDNNGVLQTTTEKFKPENYLYHCDLSDGAYGALEFKIVFGLTDVYTNDKPGVLTLYLNGTSIPEEYLRIGFNNKADAFFIDRGHTNVQWCHENPFFTDKVSVNAYKMEIKDNGDGVERGMFSIHGIIDRNIMELFFNEDNDQYSINTSTNTFFFTGGNFIGSIDLKISDNTNDGYYIESFYARQLHQLPNVNTNTTISDTPVTPGEEESP